MIAAQLERRGIRSPGVEGSLYRWHQLGHVGSQAILSVDVLSEPFPADLISHQAIDYTPALRLCQLPSGHVVIIEEQGELLLAVSHQGWLLHSHIFAQRPTTAATLTQELHLTRLSLQALPGVEPFNAITLVGDWDAELVNHLCQQVGMPVQVVERLAPQADTHSKNTLLPRPVKLARAAAAKRRKWLRLMLLALLGLAALVILGWLHVNSMQKQLADIAKETEQTRAPAAVVRETATRWKAMQPALEPKRYALVIMNQITSILPPSGVVIRKFEFKMDAIEIKGEARDAQTAFQFLEDLKKHKDLGSRWDWNMPQPSVRDNKSATYNIQAKPKS
jgi:hypothetical protein